MDKINEKKSLATERILFILEDLNQLKQLSLGPLSNLMAQKIQ